MSATVRCLLPFLALAGCTTVPVAAPPQIVTVTHTVYQPIPAALLVPCLVPTGLPKINGDLLFNDQTAISYLRTCNDRLKQIQALKPPAA